MMGETANIRSNKFFYIQIIIIRNPLPYLKRNKEVKKWETINDKDIFKYQKLLKIDKKQYFKPDLLFIKLYEITGEDKYKITGDDNDISIKENSSELDKTKKFYKKHSNLNKLRNHIKNIFT